MSAKGDQIVFYEDDDFNGNGKRSGRHAWAPDRRPLPVDREPVTEPEYDPPGEDGFENPYFIAFFVFMIVLFIVCSMLGK
ncbi:MAG: hypothetical protein GC159_19935 [Phycisphaera sp.]|nr:hypothetical protein [Phycisphaera sp.]